MDNNNIICEYAINTLPSRYHQYHPWTLTGFTASRANWLVLADLPYGLWYWFDSVCQLNKWVPILHGNQYDYGDHKLTFTAFTRPPTRNISCLSIHVRSCFQPDVPYLGSNVQLHTNWMLSLLSYFPRHIHGIQSQVSNSTCSWNCRNNNNNILLIEERTR